MAGSAPFGVNGTYVGRFMEHIKLYCFTLTGGKRPMSVFQHIDSPDTVKVSGTARVHLFQVNGTVCFLTFKLETDA